MFVQVKRLAGRLGASETGYVSLIAAAAISGAMITGLQMLRLRVDKSQKISVESRARAIAQAANTSALNAFLLLLEDRTLLVCGHSIQPGLSDQPACTTY